MPMQTSIEAALSPQLVTYLAIYHSKMAVEHRAISLRCSEAKKCAHQAICSLHLAAADFYRNGNIEAADFYARLASDMAEKVEAFSLPASA